MMALIFDREIVNPPIQMINKNNVLLYVFRMAKDRFAKSNAANVKLCLISGYICQSSQYNVVVFIIKILTLIIIINNFFHYCLMFPCIRTCYMLVGN